MFANYGQSLEFGPQYKIKQVSGTRLDSQHWERRKIRSLMSSFVDHVASLRLTWDAVTVFKVVRVGQTKGILMKYFRV